MTQQAYVPFAEIVSELQRLCSEKKTGILYLTTEEKRSAQLMMDQGEIVYLYCSNKRGKAALQMLSEIRSGKYRFQEGSTPAMRTKLPSTAEILAEISVDYGQVADNGVTVHEPESTKAAVTSDGQGGPLLSLTVEQKQLLQEGLAVFIGPMAAIICEDHLGQVQDIQTAIDLLAAEIPAGDQADTFRKEMLNRLS